MTDNGVLRAGLTELADEVEIVDLRDRVRAGVRRRAALRTAAVGGTAAVATAAVVAAGALVRTDDGGPVPAGPIREVDFRNATFTIPPWPLDDPRTSDFTSFCGAGPLEFRDGESVRTNPEPIFSPPAPPYGGAPYRISAPPIYAELDGEPGEDALLLVTCIPSGGFDALLGLTLEGNGDLRTLGWVYPPFSGNAGHDRDDVAVNRRDVVLQLHPWDEAMGLVAQPRFEQVRRYRYEDGAFRQVGGPTEWPAPITYVDDVDFANYSVGFYGSEVTPGGCNGDAIVLSNGVAEDTYGASGRMRYELRQVHFGHVEVYGDSAILTFRCTRLTDNAVFEAVFVTTVWSGILNLLNPVVATDRDGVRGIVSTRVEDELIVVTVRTATGEEVWRYGADGMGQFERR
jgi:hypothetical protein